MWLFLISPRLEGLKKKIQSGQQKNYLAPGKHSSGTEYIFTFILQILKKTSLKHSLKLCMIFHPDKLGSCQCFLKQSLFTYAFFSHFPLFSFSTHNHQLHIFFLIISHAFSVTTRNNLYCPLLFAALKILYNISPTTTNNHNNNIIV